LDITRSIATIHTPFTEVEWTDGAACHTYLLLNSDLVVLADKLVTLALIQAITPEARICSKLHYPE